MRAIYILVFLLQFSLVAFTQVTVTNPTNTTPNLAATYTSLGNAITALNSITSISGPITITLNAGNPETTPAGGYVIQFSAATTAANSITISGSNNTITAFAPQTAGNLNDGIFTIIGADYITIQQFTMQENPANTTTTAGTNNMTEFGVALFRASPTDGAQYNRIQNNTISLSLAYSNSFGVYSNTRTTASAVTAVSDITNVSGSNLGNKVYANAISNVNYGIVFNGSGTAAYMDDGNDIGGNSVATGNTISNWGISAAASGYVNLTGSNYAIYVNHQVNENVSYNTITGANHTTTNTIGGILKNYTVAGPTGVNTSTISYNTITVTSSNATAFMQVIQSASVAAASSTTLNITYNTIQNCAVTGATTTAQFIGIVNSWATGTLNITNNIIKGNTSTATNAIFQGITNSGAVVNTVNINNNQLGIAGAGLITSTNANNQVYNCILNSAGAATSTINMNNNSIDGISVVTTGAFNGIVNTATLPLAVNMNYNQLGSVTGTLVTFNGAQSNTFTGLNSSAGAASATSSVQYNDIRGIVHIATGTNIEYYIYTNRAVNTTTVSNNTFTNISTKTSGAVYLIFRGTNMTSGQTYTSNYNAIVTAFAKTANSGTFYGFDSESQSATGSSMTATGNNFSNITVSSFSQIYLWNDREGNVTTHTGPTKTITNNTFNQVAGSNGIYGIYESYSTGCTISGNTISNIIAGQSSTNPIYVKDDAQTSVDISNNTIFNLISQGGIVNAIFVWSQFLPVWNIHHNSIYNLSSANTAAQVIGIMVNGGITTNVYNNTIHDLSQSADSFFPTIVGINFDGGTTAPGTTNNVYNNKIYTLTATGDNNPSTVVVQGIYSEWGEINNFYNNFISDLNATRTNYWDAIRGIEIHSGQDPATFNLYYNSIYINAVSTGTSFGTTGIWHFNGTNTTTGKLNMINNIVKNTSTANGAGITAVLRRNSTAFVNFATTTNYNLYYAGTPSATKVIYNDWTNSYQTLAAYQAQVSPRDANAISVSPNFVSITDLHITGINCTIDGKGTPIPGYTTDIDGDTRDAVNPDMGADEFGATYGPALAGVAGSPTCSNKVVSPAGTVYGTPACELIAKVLPSGGAAVSGNINACVTLDATLQYFNAEPYVQRRFDIEPATANTTTTSATITLYFYDAEFVSFNTNTVGWPKLPTVAGGGNADPNIANLRVTQYHGTATTTPSSPGYYTGGGAGVYINPADPNIVWNGSYWAVTFDITGFSGFYVHTNPFFPLPVSVNYLKATKQGDDHLLNWSVTCNGTTGVTMTLERSADQRNFAGIYSITADATRCNQPFNFTDMQPLTGMNYYRLKIVDVDGKITYSNMTWLLNRSKGFELVNISPNPVVNGKLNLNIASAQSIPVNLVISDIQGRIVKRQELKLAEGSNNFQLNMGQLAPGTYTINVLSNNEKQVLRFVKQ